MVLLAQCDAAIGNILGVANFASEIWACLLKNRRVAMFSLDGLDMANSVHFRLPSFSLVKKKFLAS